MISKLANYFKTNHYNTNIDFIKRRREEQFQLLSRYNLAQNPKVLTATLKELRDIPDSIHTFANRARKFQYLNALADINIERALEKPGSIPFSVKNQLKVKGMIQTCGYAINASEKNIAKQSCVVVDILEQHGMIAYMQSNVPQGLWGIESNNRVFGVSTNPYDSRFVSGGSSGGEAALVRMACSAFGIGSDMAGSVRIPASFCGIYSFKPTGSRRLSKKGRLSLTGSEIQVIKQVDPTLGFMTRCVADLEYLLNLTLGKGCSKDWTVHGEWEQTSYKEALSKKMVIGYMIDTPEVETAPSIREAIKQTIKQLSQQGHKVVEFMFDELPQFRDNINKINSTPGIYKTIVNKLEGEPILQHNREMAILQSLGNWALSLRAMLSREPEEKKIYQNLRSLSLMDYFGVIAQNEALKDKFVKKWEENGLDILITPVTPFTALLKGASKYLVNQLTFCCFQNLLEMPAGVVPISLAKGKSSYPQYTDSRFYGRLMKQSIEQSEGLPVCIQVTAKPYRDQECLAAMKTLEDLVGRIPVPKQFYI